MCVLDLDNFYLSPSLKPFSSSSSCSTFPFLFPAGYLVPTADPTFVCVYVLFTLASVHAVQSHSSKSGEEEEEATGLVSIATS